MKPALVILHEAGNQYFFLFSIWPLATTIFRSEIQVLYNDFYGKSVLNQPSEMKYPKYSQMTKFLFYRYSPETPREGEPSELFCEAGDTF